MCGRGGNEEKVDKEITCMERVHHCKNILHGLHASSFVCIEGRYYRRQKNEMYYETAEGRGVLCYKRRIEVC